MESTAAEYRQAMTRRPGSLELTDWSARTIALRFVAGGRSASLPKPTRKPWQFRQGRALIGGGAASGAMLSILGHLAIGDVPQNAETKLATSGDPRPATSL